MSKPQKKKIELQILVCIDTKKRLNRVNELLP